MKFRKKKIVKKLSIIILHIFSNFDIKILNKLLEIWNHRKYCKEFFCSNAEVRKLFKKNFEYLGNYFFKIFFYPIFTKQHKWVFHLSCSKSIFYEEAKFHIIRYTRKLYFFEETQFLISRNHALCSQISNLQLKQNSFYCT